VSIGAPIASRVSRYKESSAAAESMYTAKIEGINLNSYVGHIPLYKPRPGVPFPRSVSSISRSGRFGELNSQQIRLVFNFHVPRSALYEMSMVSTLKFILAGAGPVPASLPSLT
jgi:hypothetical protein